MISKISPVLIIGMARSGTTLVSHILGGLEGVHIEVEPHALWKSGNFKYLNDEEYDVTDKIVNNIRQKLTRNIGNKRLVEKSPINSLRPHLVHAVFPDAKIVYIERDPVRCIYSNYNRSLKKDSFKLSIILKKYFKYTGSEDLAGAISERKLFQQISVSDLLSFIRYTAKMFYLRQVEDMLPFGPKLKNFAAIVRDKGLLAYHADVYHASLRYKQVYQDLYKNNMQVFKMEDIMHGKEQIEALVNFAGLPYKAEWLEKIQLSFDKERIKDAVKINEVDDQIIGLLEKKNK